MTSPLQADSLEARILYRDASVLIIDKPAGLAVHQAPGAGRTLEPLLAGLAFGLKWHPTPAHRLDRDTSGCLVLGRHPKAVRDLNQIFASGSVEKTYWAVVSGVPAEDHGIVTSPLLKVHRGKKWFMVADPAGQSALTHWKVLGRSGDRSWLELTPKTGRTHQIRVHCAEIGCPVLGDTSYSGAADLGQRLHLHARAIRFTYGKKTIGGEAAPPAHMIPALTELGYDDSPQAESDESDTSASAFDDSGTVLLQ